MDRSLMTNLCQLCFLFDLNQGVLDEEDSIRPSLAADAELCLLALVLCTA